MTNKPEPLEDFEFTKGVVEAGLSILATSPSSMSLTEWNDFSSGALALISEIERLRELNSVRYMNNLALDAAVGEIDKLTQYSSGNPEAQLFAVQQIVRDLRNAAKAAEGES
jgi:hypothetical protein